MLFSCIRQLCLFIDGGHTHTHNYGVVSHTDTAVLYTHTEKLHRKHTDNVYVRKIEGNVSLKSHETRKKWCELC